MSDDARVGWLSGAMMYAVGRQDWGTLMAMLDEVKPAFDAAKIPFMRYPVMPQKQDVIQ